jgi:glycine cleavage system transcriptional repressor
MTILGGEFVMILVVNLQKEEDAEQFHARLRDVETRFGLAVSLKPLEPWAEQKMDRQSFDVYTISVYGSDKPGIVYQITDELARQNVNVTDVDTKRVGPASRSVYVMMLEVDVPVGLDFDRVVSNLRKIASELGVDLTVNSAEALPL